MLNVFKKSLFLTVMVFSVVNVFAENNIKIVKVKPALVQDVPLAPNAFELRMFLVDHFYSQKNKDISLAQAIEKRDYSEIKFWLERGGRLAKDLDCLFFEQHTTTADLLGIYKPNSIKYNPAFFESLLKLLSPYGIKQIKVHRFGDAWDKQDGFKDFEETIIYEIK